MRDDPKRVKEFIQSRLRHRLRGIVDAGPYTDQQEEFRLTLEEFDAVHTEEGQRYLMTRREAVRGLAAMPFVLPLNLAESRVMLYAMQGKPAMH